MKSVVLCLLFALLCITSASPICPSDVGTYIDKIFANCSLCYDSHWGVLAQQLTDSGPQVLYSYNQQKFFAPASNNKILTTSSAFFSLGTNFAITTPIYLSPDSKSVCLAGKGDPSMTDVTLKGIASTIAAKGLSNIQLIVDDGYYQGQNFPPAWEWEDLTADYGGQPSALIVNENNIDITVSPTTVGQPVSVSFPNPFYNTYLQYVINAVTTDSNSPNTLEADILPASPVIYINGDLPAGAAPSTYTIAAMDPTGHFLAMLAYYLNQTNVNVIKSSVGACDPTWQQISSVTSPSLVTMMNYTLQVSDNLYAETFMKQQGVIVPPQPGMDTVDLGLQFVESVLTTKFGVNASSFKQIDGSGLSFQNLVSPEALVQTLTTMHGMPNGDIYLTFLPTAGESGTLEYRYIGTPAQGILHAKTGSLTGVNTLSGFIDHKDSNHPVIIFSILQNGSNQPGSAVRAVIDQIGVTLASVQNC